MDFCFFGGFYHLCGKILEGGEPWESVTQGQIGVDNPCFIELGKGYRAAFTEEVDLLENGFPEPVIQMEIQASIPWLLNEVKDY